MSRPGLIQRASDEKEKKGGEPEKIGNKRSKLVFIMKKFYFPMKGDPL